MSKNKVTAQDLEQMGLFETSPGVFGKKPLDPKHQTVGFEIKKELPDVDLNPYDGHPDSRLELDEIGLAEKVINSLITTGTAMVRTTFIDPYRQTEPFPIHEIRLMTGKKRDTAVQELHEAAKSLVQNLGPTDIYIPTNVASSKNSKQLFKTGKKNAQVVQDKQGNTHTTIRETSFITDSVVSKAYRKETAKSWEINRLKFLSALQGLKMPYRVEFTFIRKTLGRMDFHNMAQLPLDIMVEYGYLPDDESTVVVPVFNPVVFYSKHFAGIVIRVLR